MNQSKDALIKYQPNPHITSLGIGYYSNSRPLVPSMKQGSKLYVDPAAVLHI